MTFDVQLGNVSGVNCEFTPVNLIPQDHIVSNATVIRTVKQTATLSRRTHRNLDRFLKLCRVLWNAALQERIDYHKKTGDYISYEDQSGSLTEIRDDDPEWDAFLCDAMRTPLRRLNKAFKNTSRRKRKGLSERTYSCNECGMVMDRDINAAKNILRLGSKSVGWEIDQGHPDASENVDFDVGEFITRRRQDVEKYASVVYKSQTN